MPSPAARDAVSLPVLSPDPDRRAGTRMGRRRAIALVVVHVLVGLHILHGRLAGSTMTPLEPSEAGHAIRTGAINAGAIFLVVLILSTLVLGRFFCGWACHLVAYQDAARWILVKLGLRPRPVRARLLMLAPLFGVYWLYGRPLVARWTEGAPARGASLHLMTDDFWATFPGPAVTVLTFFVCGFVVVYVLGAKGFCTYGCPYGALFGLADRAAPGRIRVNEDCRQTGACTRTCSSNVDVAHEVATYGMVVDPGCMKCMDCVTVCPNDALRFAFAASPGVAGRRAKRPRPQREYDLGWGEELLAAGLFAGLFWTYFNLYRMVPFLLAVGACAIGAYLLLACARLVYRSDVTVQRLVLERGGRLTWAGRAAGAAGIGLVLLTAHGAVIQWHTKAAVAAFDAARAARVDGDDDAASAAVNTTRRHLATIDHWGLLSLRGAGRMLGELHRWAGEHEAAVASFDRELASGARNATVHAYRGLALHALGRVEAARASLERAVASGAAPREQFMEIDWELGRLPDAQTRRPAARDVEETRLAMLRLAIERHPDDGDAAMLLCRLLVRSPFPELADRAEALAVAERVSARAAPAHADLLAMLAWLYGEEGRSAEAVAAAERSVRAAEAQGQTQVAEEMRRAIEVYRRAGARGG